MRVIPFEMASIDIGFFRRIWHMAGGILEPAGFR